MTILLVGLNHRTAPVALRERLTLSGCGMTMALNDLPVRTALYDNALSGSNGSGRSAEPLPLQEAVILSTCNRLEVYANPRTIAGGRAAIEEFISRLQNIPLSTLKPHLYFVHGQDVVVHLMRVAAGLDSMILGESQILGQVSDAFTMAKTANTTGPILSHLFSQAVHAGKRARTETSISRHTTSVSHAAAGMVAEKMGGLEEAKVLVIGAGEMAEVALQAMVDRGARNLTCMNRTFNSVVELAERFGGQARPWHEIPEGLAWADAVVSATGAPHTIIQPDTVSEILPERAGRPLLFLDVAVPRDVDEAVGDLPNVERYDIDDLQHVLDENMAQREAAIPQVEAIIAQEAATFAEWLSSRQVVPVIADLRRYAAEIAEAEVEAALNRLGDLSEREQQVVDRLARRIVNKLFHEPTVRLRAQAADGHGYAYAHVVRELFGLDELNETPASHPNSNGHLADERPAEVVETGETAGD
jgi:glutamyl-tRNA reductase